MISWQYAALLGFFATAWFLWALSGRAELEHENAEARAYLARLVARRGAQPLPDLMGLCTQVDNILAGHRE